MPTVDAHIYFKAVLRPNPPMPRYVCYYIVTAIAAMTLIVGLVFVLRGAWPVSPFMGADVLFLAWALSSSSKRARQREELLLTGSALCVDYYPLRGEPTHIELNPYWVRVHVEEQVRSPGAVTLASHGRQLRIGSFLSPCERLSLAQALRSALESVQQRA